MLRYAFEELVSRVLDRVQSPARTKRRHAYRFFRDKQRHEGVLRNDHYRRFYTGHFGLDDAFFRGRRLLDIGCGPRGSLEWADMAAQRVGLDPLVDSYRSLGIDRHAMQYVQAPAERIPFPDGHFDVAFSFNSLDHVDDLDQAIGEITRVLAPGGCFCLITDVNHRATITEPIEFSWDVVDRFAPGLRAVDVRHFEARDPRGIYQSLAQDIPFDHADPRFRTGILTARFERLG